MIRTTAGAEMVRKTGEDLLESGLFSDAEVSAGDKVWRVHTAILCSRSDYFKKAFTGRFKEGQTGKLKIRNQDPDNVYRLLKFLYTGHLPRQLKLSQLLELYNAADYFGIDSLQTDILANLKTKFLQQGRDIWRYRNDPNAALRRMRQNWTDDDLKQSFSAARIVYTQPGNFEMPRKYFAKFLQTTYAIVGRDIRFIDALKELPELAVVIVELMMDASNQGAKSMVSLEQPEKCDNCLSKDIWAHPCAQTWVSTDNASRKLMVRGLCDRCYKIDKN
ncbi:hypothetical protein PG994_004937 [Apiospora phragmitis]|uniref:BTB domain-containing protein n=1 Tax=Apiospora phragmitis TaxID=2905665 RepID=A0ABR1VS07_9PEZI